MAREIYAVRVRELPTWAAQSGVVVWSGAAPVEVQGYRKIWAAAGPSRDGVGQVVLTFVQERGKWPIAPAYMRDLEAWAAEWFAPVA